MFLSRSGVIGRKEHFAKSRIDSFGRQLWPTTTNKVPEPELQLMLHQLALEPC